MCFILLYEMEKTIMDQVKKGLQISFNSLNKGLDACIQQLQELTQTVFLDEAIQDFQKLTEAYKKFRKKFQSQNFCYDEDLCGRFDKEAAENTRLRKEAFAEIKLCLSLLKSSLKVKNKNIVSKVIWDFKEEVENTMPYKIYALSSHNSAYPYEVPEKEESEFNTKTSELRWRFVGFAENIFEAWYYIQHDTYNGVNPCMGREPVNHVLCEPSDEYYNDFAKIESQYYTEYFDIYAPGPLGQRYCYRKTEPICFFCGKTFEGYGEKIYPINWMSDSSYGYNRCCSSCYNSIITPLKAYDRRDLQQKQEREKKITDLRIKYNLVMPQFKE